MASDLGVSISVSAVVGGALSGLTSVGKAMDTLKTTTDNLRRRQTELGDTLTRNKERLGVASAKQLWQEYDKIGASIAKLEVRYSKLNAVRAQKAVNQQKWEGIKSSWTGALAAAGTLAAPVTLAIEFESSMAGVKKVVDFETPQQFREMGQDVLALTRSIPMAATEIADIVAAGILPNEKIAENAIPLCNIVYVAGDDMRSQLSPLFEILFAANPASVGGQVPDEGFYYLGK